jgi:hypothetical protein
VNTHPGVLGGRPLTAAIAVPATITVSQASAHAQGRWIVVVDAAGTPQAAAGPGTLDHHAADRPLATVVRDLPAAIVADAATPLRKVLAPWMLDELDTTSAVIVVADGAVQGVWAGEDLFQAVLDAERPRSTFGDAELPGEITIPMLLKACTFQENTTPCTAVRRFPERPSAMPPCDNPSGLTQHQFRW